MTKYLTMRYHRWPTHIIIDKGIHAHPKSNITPNIQITENHIVNIYLGTKGGSLKNVPHLLPR